jgi:cell wall-associated NlpC family hydrolase
MTISLAGIVAEANKFVGTRYVYGGTTPAGWDCSGFVQYVLKQVGASGVPRTSEQQYAWAQHISKAQLQPGDLVFAQFPGDNASPGHVGIYVGGGEVLSAEDPAHGTENSSLASWGTNVVGYGRVPSAAAGSSAGNASGGNSGGGLLSIPAEITSFFTQANTFVTALMWLASPGSWVRIGAFIVGVALLLFAIHALVATANGSPIVSSPSMIPVPV